MTSTAFVHLDHLTHNLELPRELAGKFGTINYEIVTSIAARVRREVV